jgi:ceramide glucosyltransferase
MVPIIAGSFYYIVCFICVLIFRSRASLTPRTPIGGWPAVSILKPVYGLEKDLERNLRSICLQNYPQYQVVFSVQNRNDAAIPLLRKLQEEFGPHQVTVVVEQRRVGANGKVNNLVGGLAYAQHDILVISDSDVSTGPDYLKTIVAPLENVDVGFVCTLFKAISAGSWFERMELLTMNASFFPDTAFAYVTKSANFCIGASVAFRRSILKQIGGLEGLADYFVEDYEMGRRICEQGKKSVVAPYVVECTVDLTKPSQWWNHQIYWDQNCCVVKPVALFSTLLVRAVPFALAFAILRLADPFSLFVLGATVALRLAVAAGILEFGLNDREGLKSLLLLPLRDVVGLVSLILALMKKTTVRRDKVFTLTKGGRMISQEVPSCENSSSLPTTSVLPSR